MKKILSILEAIGLTATSTTSLIACDKPKPDNNSENRGGNKPKSLIPQQPPKDSNWKIVTDYNSFDFNLDNKFYFFISKTSNGSKIRILKFKHDTHYARWIDDVAFIPGDIKVYNEANWLKGLYCWDGDGEPQTPKINFITGEITDWKE